MTTPPTARQVARQISKWVEVSAHCGCGDTSRGCAEYSYIIDVPAAEVAIQEALDAAVRAERERCATFVETLEWRDLPQDAYPVSKSRFKLVLGQLMLDIAAALRAPEAS